jgi:predicted Zn-dependent protease
MSAALRSGRCLSAVGLAVLLAACAVNPVTGKRQLALISEAQEIAMGRQAAAEATQALGLVRDDALQQYVSRLGLRLAKASERPELPWSFAVVDDPTPNAFALPGGFIFMTRGMMNLMESEAELASVLGHEIGHVTARHSVSQMSKQQLAQLGLGLGGVFFPEVAQAGDALSAGLGLLFLKYGRDAERQADDLGFAYARTGGYDVREMDDVFAALARVGGEQRSALPTWMSTHPAPEERIERLQKRLAETPAQTGARVARAEYLQRIDGLAYGEDPRQGFFEDGVFHHPELAFRVVFPQGWEARNLPQAVVAVSPNRDAALELTLAPGEPAAAARQFLSQPGLAPRQSSPETINGLPAVVSAFEAATPQGPVAGYVAHVGYGSRTYQLVAYSGGDRITAYQRAFEQTIGSFAREVDARVLNVRPNRVDIVRLERAMTLAEFHARHRPAVPVEELALLNQLEGGEATLEAGRLVKSVTGNAPVARRQPGRR